MEAEHPKEKYKHGSHVAQLGFQEHSTQTVLTLQAHVAFPWHQAVPQFPHPPCDVLTDFYGGCSGKGVNGSTPDPKSDFSVQKGVGGIQQQGQAGRPWSQDQWIQRTHQSNKMQTLHEMEFWAHPSCADPHTEHGRALGIHLAPCEAPTETQPWSALHQEAPTFPKLDTCRN